MAMKDRLIHVLGGVTPRDHAVRIARAIEAAYQDLGEDEPVSGTLKRQGYGTGLSSAVRSLGTLDYDKVLSTAWKVYLSNPVARRALEVKRDYILGQGITIESDEKELQKVLDAFWSDNDLDRRIKEFVLQYRVLGEQCYPVFVRQSDGQVRLGYIDPAQIERVIQHPENALERWAVVLKEAGLGDEWQQADSRRRVYRIARADRLVADSGEVKPARYEGKLVADGQATLEEWEARMLKAYSLSEYTGSCLYFAANAASNQARGYSDLFGVIDWPDILTDVLRALARREQILDYFLVDLLLTGADDNAIATKQRQLNATPPKKASWWVHNEKADLKIVQPDLKQAGSIEVANMLLTFILGGLGLPRHWYGFGDETNRATAEAQNDPTWRTMEQAQDETRDMVLTMGAFARDQAIIAGALKENATDASLDVNMPEMTSKDLQKVTASLAQLGTALAVAEQNAWLSGQTQREVWAKVISEVGVDVSAAEEQERMDEETVAEDEKQAAANNEKLKSMLNLPPEEMQFGQPANPAPSAGVQPPQLAAAQQAKMMGGEFANG